MIAKYKRSLWVGIVAVFVLGLGAIVAHSTPTHADPAADKKVFVCKYVGTPNVDERLQTGQNPISVSTNSIAHNGWDGTVGSATSWFSDAQGRSYVLEYDNTGNGGGQQGEPSVADCPAPASPHNAYASILVSAPTCSMGAVLTYGPATYATYSGTQSGTMGPGSYNVTATADPGHLFAVNGLGTLSWSNTLAGKLPTQSTNPDLPCYHPPEVVTATASVEILPATCDHGDELTYVSTHASATQGSTPNHTFGVGVAGTPYMVTFVADQGAAFAQGAQTMWNGTLNGPITEGCDGEVQPSVATAEVKIIPATCEAGQKLVYVNVQNAAATEGSTADGTVGTGNGTPYSVSFVANEGAAFAEGAQTSWEGTLSGPLTGEACVLGETTGTPSTPSTPASTSSPAVLPDTTGEGTVALVVGGSLLVAVLGIAGSRRFLGRSL